MTDSKVTQRLVAILAADVYGYSRLMQDDAQATVATLDASRQVFRDQIVTHQGRVVDMAGALRLGASVEVDLPGDARRPRERRQPPPPSDDRRRRRPRPPW